MACTEPWHKGDGKKKKKRKTFLALKQWSEKTQARSVDESLDAVFGKMNRSKTPFKARLG